MADRSSGSERRERRLDSSADRPFRVPGRRILKRLLIAGLVSFLSLGFFVGALVLTLVRAGSLSRIPNFGFLAVAFFAGLFFVYWVQPTWERLDEFRQTYRPTWNGLFVHFFPAGQMVISWDTIEWIGERPDGDYVVAYEPAGALRLSREISDLEILVDAIRDLSGARTLKLDDASSVQATRLLPRQLGAVALLTISTSVAVLELWLYSSGFLTDWLDPWMAIGLLLLSIGTLGTMAIYGLFGLVASRRESETR